MIHYLSKTKVRLIRGTALLRLDFNTEDDWRMKAVLPTIAFLLKKGCKIVIVSHRGRPIGVDQKFSLRKDAAHLAELLRKKVVFFGQFDFPEAKKTVAEAPRGSVFLFENLRFLAGEETNDPRLAKLLASLGDFYVNDAFAVSHRANASIAAITDFLPSYAGLELEAELTHLSRVMARPKRPLVMVVGGAKVSDKLGVLRYFRNKADWFLLGGGPANTMLSVQGMDVRRSLKDDHDDISAIKKIAQYPNIVLPGDFVWAKNAIVDIGPKTTALFVKWIKKARTIVWSGPLGLIDERPYRRGSIAVAKAIAQNSKALSVAGGGETVMFLKGIHLDRKFTFISTGGGAMLDFLAGKKLPGIVALNKKTNKT
jgi:phosphoglycerate kinase